MQGQADREVLFTLKAVTDQGAAGVFQQFAKLGDSAFQHLEQSAAATAKNITARFRESFDASAVKQAISATTKAVEQSAARQAKAAEKRFSSEVDLLRRTAAEEKKRWEAEEKSRLKAEKEAERMRQREESAREKAMRDQERNVRQYESATERQRSLSMQSRMAIAELGEGVNRTLRGFAQLGILSEETTEGLVRGFIKVESVFNILAGGIKVYKSLTVMVDSYTKSVEAAALAERALAAARAQSAAAGAGPVVAGGAGRGLRQVGGNVLAGGVGAAGGGAIAGGVPAGAAGFMGTLGMFGLGGLAIGEAGLAAGLMTPWGQRKAESALIRAMGGGRGETPPGFFSKSAAYMSGSMSPMQWVRTGQDPWESVEQSQQVFADADRAKALSDRMTADQKAAREIAERVRTKTRDDLARDREADEAFRLSREDRFAIQSGIDIGRTQQDIARSAYAESAVRSEVDRLRQRRDSAATESERAAIEARLREAEQRAGASTGAREAAQSAGWTTKLGAAGDVQQRARADAQSARERLAEYERQQAEFRSGNTIDGRYPGAGEVAELEERLQSAREAAAEAGQREIAAAQERLQVEQEITAEKIRAADESIARTEQEISLREQWIENERQRLMSAEERFGQLTTAEQQQVIGIAQRAEAGDKNLTVEEMQKLQRVGTREAKQLASDFFRQRAEAGGFSERFGGKERANIEEWAGEKSQLEVRLKDQREFKVSLERDDAKLADQLASQVEDILETRDAELEQRFSDVLERRLNGMNRQRAEAAQARRAVIR